MTSKSTLPWIKKNSSISIQHNINIHNQLYVRKGNKSKLLFLMVFLFTNLLISESFANGQGWYLTNYSFKDGTGKSSTVLAGTTSKMNDITSFTGERGNVEITKNRFDEKTGTLLAGVTYKVRWSDLPEYLNSGEKVSLNYELVTVKSLKWKPVQQSVYLNQGSGVYFSNPTGLKYITSDMNTVLTSEKEIISGNKGATRTITVTLGQGFSAIYTYEWRDGQQTVATVSKAAGWYLSNYAFKDGSTKSSTVLAGTTSKMNDITSFTGDRGNVEITKSRFDEKTGTLLAGVTYRVKWSDLPEYINPGENVSLNYELITVKSLKWKPVQQSVYLNQGAGVYFSNSSGLKYITSDVNTILTSEKVIAPGSKGATKTITVTLGQGFSAIYTYEWREI